MANVWTVTGEAGKAMDATSRTFGTDIDAASGVVVFRSCSPDTFTYSIECDSSTPASSIPELTQSVTLFRDGVKFFSGIVTDLKQNQDLVTVVVSGPWWWLDNVSAETTRVDGAGTFASRPSFPIGGTAFGDSLGFAIDSAIAAGVPITKGSIPSFFATPSITINQSTYGQMMAEVVRLIPDTMTWFDYSTTTPTLNITRRGTATTRTIDISDCSTFEASPILQLKVEQVKLPYVTRASNGRTKYQTQTAGTAALGKIGVVVQSGPELDTYLPNDYYNSFKIQTFPASPTDDAVKAFVNSKDQFIAGIISKYGASWYSTPTSASTPYVGNIFYDYIAIEYHSSRPSSSGGGLRAIVSDYVLPPSGQYLVISEDSIPDWASAQNGYTVRDFDFNYSIGVVFDYGTSSEWNPGMPVVPGIIEFQTRCDTVLLDWWGPFASTRPRRSIFIYNGTLKMKTISQAFSGGLYTIRQAASYDFTSIPTDFAANLLASQNWIPYQGRLSMPGDEVGGTRYRGCKVNVNNSRISAHASMAALVESEELDLMTNTTTVNLGAPPRVDYKTWVDKIRKTPQDNIIFF